MPKVSLAPVSARKGRAASHAKATGERAAASKQPQRAPLGRSEVRRAAGEQGLRLKHPLEVRG